MMVETFKVEVPGGRVYVKKWVPGRDSGKAPVVLLHDSLGCVDLWRDFPEKLADSLSRCVYAYDRLGFGRSDRREALPSRGFIEEEASTYFPAIKDQLSVENYALLGHSVGGGMAINIASQDSDCRGVVTVSAQAFVEDLTIDGIRKSKQMFEQPGQIERLVKWHEQKAKWVLRAWTDVWLSPGFKNWSLEPAIQKVRCPVLVIHGDSDEYGSSAFPEFISKHAGGQASMLIIENCGHMPHKEKRQEVIGVVENFLDSIV